LDTASLGAYTDETAVKFLKALGQSKNLELSDEVCQAVLKQIGWPLPFFLQLVFHRLTSLLGRPPRRPTPADVETAGRQLISPDFYKHFEPWRGRLVEGLGPDEYRAAVAILNALSSRPEGLPRTNLRDAVAARFGQRDAEDVARLLSAVLGQLERDGYILRTDGESGAPVRYAFRSFLLRQYWFAREVA
jgi:hypothetical protein